GPLLWLAHLRAFVAMPPHVIIGGRRALVDYGQINLHYTDSRCVLPILRNTCIALLKVTARPLSTMSRLWKRLALLKSPSPETAEQSNGPGNLAPVVCSSRRDFPLDAR